MNNTKMRFVAAAASIASVTAVGLASMGAGAAAAASLPGAFTSTTLVDGTKVTVELKNQSYGVQRSTVALPTSRNVTVSGQVIVTIGGKAVGANVLAGYLVGCQLSFSSNGGIDGGADIDLTNQTTPIVPDDDSTNGGSGSFAIAPGQAAYVPIVDTTDSDGNKVNSFSIAGKRGGIAYSGERFSVDACAGYASAKPKIVVTVSTDAVDGVVTLYGKQFSLF
ncbi:hypothetical protein ASG12_16555 [Williamsia sp. Leaf354]|uniref:MspA family porin n=1 Tax=Williamsia sp. Leaf354 TaxID=1736349 RepID=UPI0006F44D26|nr:MspA family porin [Williamsia sp. Leaf354]KQR97519.1 hypothetical protein ASG12_16555 [Williamsia sp. Leaf354]